MSGAPSPNCAPWANRSFAPAEVAAFRGAWCPELRAVPGWPPHCVERANRSYRHTGAMYREWRSREPGAVVWTASTLPGVRTARIIPDGCMDLIHSGDRLLVAGPDTVAHLVDMLPGIRITGLRLPPGLGPQVLAVPADELTDLRVPLEQVSPGATVRELVARWGDESAGPAAPLEAFAAARLRPDVGSDALVSRIVSRLAAGCSVRDTAAGAAMSERQLRRRSLEAFGYGPDAGAGAPDQPGTRPDACGSPRGRGRAGMRLLRPGAPVARDRRTGGYHDAWPGVRVGRVRHLLVARRTGRRHCRRGRARWRSAVPTARPTACDAIGYRQL